MSLKLIAKEVHRFLSTAEPEVVCICRQWGVGKTFQWNRLLKDAQHEGVIACERYSYVSLFGINSLDEFKYAIFENSVKTSEIGIEPNLQTLRSNTIAAANRLGRKSLWFLQQMPLVKNYIGGLAPVWFLSVSESIICIDDIERHGAGLRVRDIMGLASALKEHKRCKIALILNDEQLEAEKAEFGTYYEKVIDSTLHFAPTPAEATSIAFPGNTRIEQLLTRSCAALGISNIRLLKKIERIALESERLLRDYGVQVHRQAVQSLALFGWSLYEPSTAPPINYLTQRNSVEYLVSHGNDPVPEKEAAWNALLDSYQFTYIDDFDLVLLEGMRNGYFDIDAMQKTASELESKFNASRLRKSFNDAWSLYHDSFEDNENEVIEAIRVAFEDGIQHISLLDLNGTVTLFKNLGRFELAAEMIEKYVQHHEGPRRHYHLASFPFRERITDPDVVNAVNEKFASCEDQSDPREVLLGLSHGWNNDDLGLLAAMPVAAYYHIFKTSSHEIRSDVINGCLQFDRVASTSEEMKEISRKARAALHRLGSESRINALRVAKYGVKVEDENRDSSE